MNYKIKIEYRTGNSFEDEDTSDVLELTWNNLEIAKENLRRIKQHEAYHRSLDKWRRTDKIDKPDCYVEGKGTIILKTDECKDWEIYPFWQGYFEQLYGAEIVSDSSDMKITIP